MRNRRVIGIVALLASVMTAGVAVAPRRSQAAPNSLEARVQRLEDEAAIRNLLVEYGQDFDTLDLVAYSKLFAKDGTWTGSIGTAKGPAAILGMLQNAMSKAPPYDPKQVRSFHLMTNFSIHVDGDHATSRSRWTFFARSDDNKLVPRLAGHYDDTFVREAGVWKFQSRTAPLDIPNPVEGQ
jgi:hypothetical protein